MNTAIPRHDRATERDGIIAVRSSVLTTNVKSVTDELRTVVVWGSSQPTRCRVGMIIRMDFMERDIIGVTFQAMSGIIVVKSNARWEHAKPGTELKNVVVRGHVLSMGCRVMQIINADLTGETTSGVKQNMGGTIVAAVNMKDVPRIPSIMIIAMSALLEQSPTSHVAESLR